MLDLRGAEIGGVKSCIWRAHMSMSMHMRIHRLGHDILHSKTSPNGLIRENPPIEDRGLGGDGDGVKKACPVGSGRKPRHAKMPIIALIIIMTMHGYGSTRTAPYA